MIFRLFCVVGLITFCGTVLAQEAVVPDAYRSLIPHRLLSLVHAPEVQQEVKLSAAQIVKLEACFAELDGPWFRCRNLPPEIQTPEVDRLEAEFWNWAETALTAAQITRLKQIELQSLGVRMFLRSDVARALNLTAAQTRELAENAQATAAELAKLQEAQQKKSPTADLEQAANAALQAEQSAYRTIIKDHQWKHFPKLVGAPFKTDQLQRIYPMAPEFAADSQWINSEPLTLQSLRGKVVLVHFYAFQCHNCHANFEIYRRWHAQWKGEEVVVIGIQSPETRTERDIEAVRRAAVERQLSFPIVMDTEMQNWNSWANTMWPTVYVIDKRGYLRFWWQGELNWQGATADKTIEEAVQSALSEPDGVK